MNKKKIVAYIFFSCTGLYLTILYQYWKSMIPNTSTSFRTSNILPTQQKWSQNTLILGNVAGTEPQCLNESIHISDLYAFNDIEFGDTIFLVTSPQRVWHLWNSQKKKKIQKVMARIQERFHTESRLFFLSQMEYLPVPIENIHLKEDTKRCFHIYQELFPEHMLSIGFNYVAYLVLLGQTPYVSPFSFSNTGPHPSKCERRAMKEWYQGKNILPLKEILVPCTPQHVPII